MNTHPSADGHAHGYVAAVRLVRACSAKIARGRTWIALSVGTGSGTEIDLNGSNVIDSRVHLLQLTCQPHECVRSDRRRARTIECTQPSRGLSLPRERDKRPAENALPTLLPEAPHAAHEWLLRSRGAGRGAGRGTRRGAGLGAVLPKEFIDNVRAIAQAEPPPRLRGHHGVVLARLGLRQ